MSLCTLAFVDVPLLVHTDKCYSKHEEDQQCREYASHRCHMCYRRTHICRLTDGCFIGLREWKGGFSRNVSTAVDLHLLMYQGAPGVLEVV